MANNGSTAITKRETNVLPPDVQQQIGIAKKQNEALMQLMGELLQEDVDYGKVPGVPKPFLHQPGAQQLGLVFKFRPEFEKVDSIIDFDQDPVFVSYEYKCRLYNKETDVFLGEGVGSCNNYERKYKYYKDQTVYEDPLDRQNTIVKMAKKRAYVDATLNVTGASRLFTQDEDLYDYNTPNASQSGEPVDVKMPFGKHKGKRLGDLPEDYLKWVADKAENADLKAAAKKVLADEKENVKKSEEPTGNNGSDTNDLIKEIYSLLETKQADEDSINNWLKETFQITLGHLSQSKYERIARKVINILKKRPDVKEPESEIKIDKEGRAYEEEGASNITDEELDDISERIDEEDPFADEEHEKTA